MSFKKAEKKRAKLKIAFAGPAGSGKTYSALAVATSLANGRATALIDTERGSASLYADKFEFDVLELAEYSPEKYVEAINQAAKGGYECLVIDSLSHAWSGPGGLLDIVSNQQKRTGGGNSFTAWKDASPMQAKLIDTILTAPLHIIATMRSKMEYVLDQVEKNGRTVSVPKRVGMAPVQKNDIEFEFSVFGELNLDHELVITKTRVDTLKDMVFKEPGKDLANLLLTWLDTGKEVIETNQDDIIWSRKINACMSVAELEALRPLLSKLENKEKLVPVYKERFAQLNGDNA